MKLGLIKELVWRAEGSYFWRKIVRMPIDPLSFFKNESEKMIPPKRLDFVGGGDFMYVGKEMLRKMIELGGLKPQDNVLDIGCGVGRMAIPLTGYLSEHSIYEGFDIVSEGVKWCNKKIAPRYSNFHFQVANIYNKAYNPSGRYKASEYVFPYQDEFFDFVLLTSIFTHMPSSEVQNYLSEISRVMRRGGRSFVTYFILDDTSLSLMERGETSFKFDIAIEQGCYALSKGIPELGIAYNEGLIRNIYSRYGLSIMEPIFHGAWRKGLKTEPFQDIVVAFKQ